MKYSKSIVGLSIIIFIILADQLSKNFLIDFLKTQPGFSLTINDFFNLVYVRNYGITFGFFTQYMNYSNVFFLITNICILTFLLIKYFSDLVYSYTLIIGGGISNLLDRIFRGAVFDFIHLHYEDYHFPVFNLADVFISLGIMIILYETFKSSKQIKT